MSEQLISGRSEPIPQPLPNAASLILNPDAPEVRGANDDEIEDVIRCCAEAFGGGDEKQMELKADFFERIHRNDPLFHPKKSRVAMLHGQVVSAVQVFERQMLIRGIPIRLGGIGSVATRPTHQKRGYGSLVIEDALAYMENQGYEISLLSTGMGDYYARFGWQPFPHLRTLNIQVPRTFPTATFPYEIRPLWWRQDLPVVAQIYRLYNRDATGPVLRSDSYWNAQVTWRPLDFTGAYVAMKEGRIVAYILAADSHERIDEFGAVPDEEQALGALAYHVIRQAQRAGRHRVSCLSHEPMRRGLEPLGLYMEDTESSRLMFRIMNLESVVKNLVPEMETRIAVAGLDKWIGDVTLNTEIGDFTLRIESGRVQLRRKFSFPTISNRTPLDHASVIDLLLGQRTLPELLQPRRLRLEGDVAEEQAMKLLEALFSRQEFRWYPRDKF